jgi:rhodanese-related sulfurtransferase
MSSVRFQVSIVLVLLAGLILLLPESRKSAGELNVPVMLEKMSSMGYLLSVDEVAKALVLEDSSLLLVDVRDPEAFRKVHIPGAINIPLPDILNPDWYGYLNDTAVSAVFYANGNTLASEAWMLCTQQGYTPGLIMQGGMNEWYRVVMESIFSGGRISASQNALFEVRYRARDFFTRMNSMPDSLKTAYVEVKRKKEAELVGGCE